MASSRPDPDSSPDSDPDLALDPGERPERGGPDPCGDDRPPDSQVDRPRCAGDRASIYPDGVDRNVPAGAADEELQAVVDHYETLLDERAHESGRRGILSRLWRWVRRQR